MKLNKRFIAILAAAVLMLLCAVPVFAEAAASSSDIVEDVLLIAPAPSASDVSATDVSAADVAVEALGADAPANVGTSFMVMGYGMLGIFIAIFAIILTVVGLGKIFPAKK